MRKRSFLIYSKGNGPYEIVPTGWSLAAALLGPFWAFANGLLLRFALLFLPIVPLAALGGLAHWAFGHVAIAYGLAIHLVYFPSKAFTWRERVLRSKGFAQQAIVNGTSAEDALRRYALAQPSEA